MEEELKPCPFCGCENSYAYEMSTGWNVVCDNIDCAMQGPWDLGKSGAIAKWNVRAYLLRSNGCVAGCRKSPMVPTLNRIIVGRRSRHCKGRSHE